MLLESGRVRMFVVVVALATLLAGSRAIAQTTSTGLHFYDHGKSVQLFSAGEDAQHRPLVFAGPQGRTRAGRLIARDAKDALTLTSDFVVQLNPGSDAAAVAKQVGATLAQPFSFAPGYYLFHSTDGIKALSAANLLVDQKKAVAAYPQLARQEHRRDAPDDPFFTSQWHLKNTGQNGGTGNQDINATAWWNFAGNANLGAGVNVAVVDDGLQWAHPDLSANYDAALSIDINYNDSDPTPDVAADNHGTAVAGVIAGVGNNSLGVTGVAPRAHVSGIRLISLPSTDTQEATGETYLNNNQNSTGTNQIYSNSWGPSDDGLTLQGPGPLLKAALVHAVTSGRGGKGSIFVWAGGNGGSFDNSNYDGYANSRYVIAVGATTNLGTQASYSERGANLFVNAPSSGGTLSITTVDRTGSSGYNTASGSAGDYTNTFGGTSASAPEVSGVVALMLEANPNLTWRDVKHILVRSSQQNNPGDSSWTTNAAGRKHSEKYGFGRVDAAAAATMAQTWTNVGPEISTSGSATVNQPIADGSGVSSPIFGAFTSSSINITDPLNVEEVEVTVNVTHPFRGDLEFLLVAPTGTQSTLGTVRDDSGSDFSNWVFTAVRDWDELSTGLWTLKIHDGFAGETGTFNNWSINIFGTSAVPEPAGAALLMACGAILARSRKR